MSNTIAQYDAAVRSCKEIFIKKTKDYGTSWRVLRPISILDQLFIKAQRIRTIQEKGVQMVSDDIRDEFMGMVNYSVIGLIQLSLKEDAIEDLPVEQVEKWYDEKILESKALMLKKITTMVKRGAA